MGEIAEMMLDGTMCAQCGVWLDGGEDGPGFPGLCSDCARRERAESRTGDMPFFIKKASQMEALREWLNARSFNCGGHFKNDKNGNPMISIGWDSRPDSDWHLPDKRGLIIVVRRDLQEQVEAMVNEIAAKKASAP